MTDEAKTRLYSKRRYVMYGITTILLFCIPFVKINGNQIFLLSFDHKQLHLLGVAFDMQELYLMPFLLILMFLAIFFMTTLAGRVWCGWACPQTIFRVLYRDLLETKILGLRKRMENRQLEPDMSLGINKAKKTIALVVWAALSLVAASNLMWYFVPPEDFFQYIQNPIEHKYLFIFWLGFAIALVAIVVFIKENFCIYMCPYSRVQSVLYDNDTIMTVYDYKRGGEVFDIKGIKLWKKPEVPNAECTGCEACVKICPTHIDIRKGMQLECINCLECSDACTKVMGRLGKPTLISWTSPQSIEDRQKVRYMRFKTIGYVIAMTVVFVGLLMMSSKKEDMLLNINRQELYTIRDNARVENSYIFLFQNTQREAHEFYFEVENNAEIQIKRPSKPFRIEAGEKSKQVVVLYTEANLAQDAQKDTHIPLTIKAYALDSKEPIEVFRESVFIYPPSKALQ
ncbi:cytochrome c oxidase accessory protein CcoG [Helicobacter sp. MIT 05-5294]|uniref:cytochrome c oxidase accessory protein CcoG n=1 Tax=Helicobacter sp. MIT 05-5294 TaxID=1548150 RepID=UPI00051FB249|nr:cytochrome c oxidase accessory protein CcoG [Helicobacter sp. MIT 05-5294]TLD85483.1 cytochrome c oxidase accessory protein CcoG [Helicobacter sp. MIT 05-5294]